MPRPLRIEYPGAWYHVMNRGLRRFEIASDSVDRAEFLAILEDTVDQHSINVHAYALMDNHYHLLVETPRGNLSRAMRHLNSVYTQRFNKRHALDGSLFRGRFKSQLIEVESYLLNLISYIHLNTVRGGIERVPQAPDRSSHPAYSGIVQKPTWLTTEVVLEYFSSRKDFDHFVLDQLNNPPRSHAAWDKERWSAILGSDSFVGRGVKEAGCRKPDPERPALRTILADLLDDEKIIKVVALRTHLLPDDLRRCKRSPRLFVAQCIVASLLSQYAGYTHSQIGKVLGNRSVSAISRMLTRANSMQRLVDEIVDDLMK